MAAFNIDPAILDSLPGKVIIITGASSGIGNATTKLFAEKGALIVAADVNPLPHDIPGVTFKKTDLTVWADQVALFEFAVKQHGHIDIAFLNAGVGEIEDVFVDKYDDQGNLLEPNYTVLKINLIAQVAGTKLAIHHMRKQKDGGAIIITGSGKAFTGVGGTPMYAAAKHGVLGLVRTLANDLGGLKIRINLMCPFWTDTGIFPPGLVEKSASAKKSMQPAICCSYAVAYLGLDPTNQGRVIYAASKTYTDLEAGLYKTRPLWMGVENDLDRKIWENDPIVEFKTPL